MIDRFPQFLIAAPSSGSGKTTVCLALMSAFRKKGLRVQPFKCGPDYIDTKFHAAVCRRSSVNLDSFMASASHLKSLYAHYSQDADVSVVEGMMGLMDGYRKDAGSPAEIARILSLPIVLVVDARSAAYSLAPLLWGMIHFHKDVRIAGVIFNKVGSQRHRQLLEQVCEDVDVPCLGYLFRNPMLEQSSRYLGLDYSQMSQHISQIDVSQIDVDKLLEVTACPRMSAEKSLFDGLVYDERRHFVVAKNDDSFSFVYAQHLDLLSHMGRLSFINPENDDELPADTTLLYLPGGYPEKHLDALAASSGTMASIRRFSAQHGRILAECGGMIYLCREILCDEGQTLPLTGVIPAAITNRKEDKRLHLGYRQFQFDGRLMRGHEFHYTDFVPGTEPVSVTEVRNAANEAVKSPVLRQNGLLASYTHLYWAEHPEVLLP